MKKVLLSAMIAGIMPTVATAAPKVYGQLDVGVYNEDYKTSYNDKVTKIESNASRIGFKGEDELTPSLSAIYQLEYGSDADQGVTVTTTGTSTTSLENFKQRNRFVGLKSQQLGAIKVGKYDSYLKLAQSKVDFFNDAANEYWDMKNTLSGENRLDNVLGYESPKFGSAANAQFNVMMRQGEQTTAVGSACNVTASDTAKGADTCEDNSIATGLSSSVVLDNLEDKGWYAAIAMDKDIQNKNAWTGKTVKTDTIRLVGSLKLPQMQGLVLNALVQTAKPSEDPKGQVADYQTDETAYLLGVGYEVTPEVLLKGQYQTSTTSVLQADKTATVDKEISQYGFGVDYAFAPKTIATLMFAQRQKEKKASTDSDKDSVIGLSLLHKF